MDAPHHYAMAERLAEIVEHWDDDFPYAMTRPEYIALAQVHATLATVPERNQPYEPPTVVTRSVADDDPDIMSLEVAEGSPASGDEVMDPGRSAPVFTPDRTVLHNLLQAHLGAQGTGTSGTESAGLLP